MSDSSSDDDDDVKKLLESVDTQFFSDDMFTRKKNQDTPNQEVKSDEVEKPKSLRYSEESTDQSNLFGLKPEVQKFIAKHLSKICDRQLEEATQKKVKKTLQKERDNHSGIYLLRNSTDFVHLEESDEEKVKIFNCKNKYQSCKSKKRKVAEDQSHFNINEDDEDTKAKVAAVSPEWVLNKEGIQGWVKTVKSEVIEGKQNADCNSGSVINEDTKKKKKKKKKKKEQVLDSVTENNNTN